MKPQTLSIIVTTYNRPDALGLVLHALEAQTQRDFEVIIADDGSNEETNELIKELHPHLSYDLTHLWQQDKGFRAARARNKAVLAAKGDYIIFLDGDSVPQKDFVKNHRKLAEKNWFIAGNRVLLQQTLTEKIVYKGLPIWQWSKWHWFLHYINRDMNRFLPLFRLPFGRYLRKMNATRWQGAKTCNLGLWREDITKINGFDEAYEGWGHEDADFVVRLIRNGIKRKEGRFSVPVFHLWHQIEDRQSEAENKTRLETILQSKETIAKKGLNAE